MLALAGHAERNRLRFRFVPTLEHAGPFVEAIDAGSVDFLGAEDRRLKRRVRAVSGARRAESGRQDAEDQEQDSRKPSHGCASFGSSAVSRETGSFASPGRPGFAVSRRRLAGGVITSCGKARPLSLMPPEKPLKF